MQFTADKQEVVRQLERDVLRNIVLLKHLNAYPDQTGAALIMSHHRMAALVLLDPHASEYDCKAYPGAAYVVLINSNQPALTRELLSRIPQNRGVVFKLSCDQDRDVVGEVFR
jgi:hypothetical protein